MKKEATEMHQAISNTLVEDVDSDLRHSQSKTSKGTSDSPIVTKDLTLAKPGRPLYLHNLTLIYYTSQVQKIPRLFSNA